MILGVEGKKIRILMFSLLFTLLMMKTVKIVEYLRQMLTLAMKSIY